VATEAVQVCRPIAAAQPNLRIQLALALALAGQAGHGVGASDAGRPAAEEAWALARALVDEDGHPPVVLFDIVRVAWPALGPADGERALTDVIERLGQPPAPRNRRMAAQSWLDLSSLRHEAGRDEDSLAALESCIGLRRQLFEEAPWVLQRQLVATLRLRAERLTALGRGDEASATTAEAESLAAEVFEAPDRESGAVPVPRPPIESALVDRAENYFTAL
jgi:hypothetical protein